MDKKKSITILRVLFACLFTIFALPISAQDVSKIQFCDKKYEYGEGKDSITLFFKVLDKNGEAVKDVTLANLEKYLVFYEEDKMISPDRYKLTAVNSGQRIPGDFTFSVLVDLSIPEEGKEQIFQTIGKLVESAPDSCVYISFFGDEVSASEMVTKANYESFKSKFHKPAESKCFYSALYSKLTEFSSTAGEFEGDIKAAAGYAKNKDILHRAQTAKDKNVLFVFTDGNKRSDDETISFIEVTDYQSNPAHQVPRVYAMYYTGNGVDENVKLTLEGVSVPRDANGTILTERQGSYKPSNDMATVLSNFQQVVNDAMYDYAFTYRATENKAYTGRVTYMAEWKGMESGKGDYSIGTAETPWPLKAESAGDAIVKILIALLMAMLTFAFFFLVMKVIIPFFKSKKFSAQYYKSYVPEANVQRRICTYCRQDIQPGQLVVTKCKHIMHVSCWQQNGYKCVEYGQNCKDGIQDHVDWKDIFNKQSLRDSYQALAGILAGLISWIIFELIGRGMLTSLSTGIAKTFFRNEEQMGNLFTDCAGKVSAFLAVGFLLGFFLSLVFRYNDEYRKKDAKIYLKIIGLSLLTGIIGMAAFAVGGIIFCLLLSAVGTTYIPWYCSLPAYILFSICINSLQYNGIVELQTVAVGRLCRDQVIACLIGNDELAEFRLLAVEDVHATDGLHSAFLVFDLLEVECRARHTDTLVFAPDDLNGIRPVLHQIIGHGITGDECHGLTRIIAHIQSRDGAPDHLRGRRKFQRHTVIELIDLIGIIHHSRQYPAIALNELADDAVLVGRVVLDAGDHLRCDVIDHLQIELILIPVRIADEIGSLLGGDGIERFLLLLLQGFDLCLDLKHFLRITGILTGHELVGTEQHDQFLALLRERRKIPLLTVIQEILVPFGEQCGQIGRLCRLGRTGIGNAFEHGILLLECSDALLDVDLCIRGVHGCDRAADAELAAVGDLVADNALAAVGNDLLVTDKDALHQLRIAPDRQQCCFGRIVLCQILYRCVDDRQHNADRNERKYGIQGTGFHGTPLLFRLLVLRIQKRNRAGRCNGGDCVLINDLLLSLAVKNDNVIVKSLDDALALESVDQIGRHEDAFFSCLVEESVL